VMISLFDSRLALGRDLAQQILVTED